MDRCPTCGSEADGECFFCEEAKSQAQWEAERAQMDEYEILWNAVKDSTDWVERFDVVNKIHDPRVLMLIASTDKDCTVKREAMKNIDNLDDLLELLFKETDFRLIEYLVYKIEFTNHRMGVPLFLQDIKNSVWFRDLKNEKQALAVWRGLHYAFERWNKTYVEIPF